MQIKDLVHCLKHNKDSTACLSSSTDFITDYPCTLKQVSSYLWASVSSLVNSTSLIGSLNGFQWSQTREAFRVIPGTQQELKKYNYYYDSNSNPSVCPIFSLQMGQFTTSDITVMRMSAWKSFLKKLVPLLDPPPPPKYSWLFWL